MGADLGHDEGRHAHEGGVGEGDLAAPVDQDVQSDGADEHDPDEAQLVGGGLARSQGKDDRSGTGCDTEGRPHRHGDPGAGGRTAHRAGVSTRHGPDRRAGPPAAR